MEMVVTPTSPVPIAATTALWPTDRLSKPPPSSPLLRKFRKADGTDTTG
jgi:hypothetical protein